MPTTYQKKRKRHIVSSRAKRTFVKAAGALVRRRRRGMARGIVRRGALRSSNQYDQLRIKCPITITYNQLLTSPDGGKYFNFIHLPWNALLSGQGESNAIGQAAVDIAKMTSLYRYYKCTGVHYELMRPKVYISQSQGIQVFNQEEEMGSMIMHSKTVNKPDSVTSVIEANADLQKRVVLKEVTSWAEGIDNDSEFKNHRNSKFVKMGWVPKTPFEKNWRDIIESDPELSTGGIHIRWKSSDVIPSLTGIGFSLNQVMLQGTAVVYMKFYQRR